MELFWGTASANQFESSRRLSQGYTAPDWQVVVFDLSNAGQWSDQVIRRLRIDPVTAANAEIEIDWIRASDGDYDDDGLADGDEVPGDADGDGIVNWRDVDADGDGTTDGAEVVAGRNKLNSSDLGFEFETDGNLEGPAG